MIDVIGYAAKHASSNLKPMAIQRHEAVSNEVQIDVLFCGVCHSDVHQARNEWKNTVYPCMPGHEIVGRVVAAGPNVTKFKIGDIVGVGCMIDSCHHCEACKTGLENYCEEGFTGTYNGNQRLPTAENLTYGGYSTSMVVREDFVLRIPENLAPHAAAPLLCAGVTTYSALKHQNISAGKKVGIVGFGGLGHMAIQIAAAMGAEVTLITTSPDKADDARKLGAADIIMSSDSNSMKVHEASLDFILSTIPKSHDVNPYLALLKREGVLTIVGCIAPSSKPVDFSKMIIDRKSLSTSLIGSIAETQEVLDFCAARNFASKVAIIPIDQVNTAFDKVDKGEIDFRYVIDMASLAGVTEEKSILEAVGL